jgi:hypothetical protein
VESAKTAVSTDLGGGEWDMGAIDLLLVSKVLFLLVVANGAPVLVKKALGDRLAFPLDGGMTLRDGRPVFGRSKTVRGIVSSIIMTSLFSVLVGLTCFTGAVLSAAAMIGDLISSFLKRRMKIQPSGMALGLDQIPEALLPALAARWMLPVTPGDVALIVSIFCIGQILISPAFYALKLRDRPY